MDFLTSQVGVRGFPWHDVGGSCWCPGLCWYSTECNVEAAPNTAKFSRQSQSNQEAQEAGNQILERVAIRFEVFELEGMQVHTRRKVVIGCFFK